MISGRIIDWSRTDQNTVEVLGVGYYNDHNDCKDCEVSSLYILGQYIELVQEEQLVKLCDLFGNNEIANHKYDDGNLTWYAYMT